MKYKHLDNFTLNQEDFLLTERLVVCVIIQLQCRCIGCLLVSVCHQNGFLC